jgi:homoserine O-acetyltransferase
MRSMPDKITENSVGIIAPISHHFDQPLTLASGKVLPAFDVVYETYGELNSNASNAILICHALSGDHHAAGYHSMDDAKPGWWDNYIGPGKVIDTNKFFVVSPNNIGGCAGSTGPATINPETAKSWGASFPRLRARDWVNVQARLADVLGIQQWAAVIGGSLGGMQAMRWSLEYPDRLRHCIVIASAMKLTAQNLAFNEIARQAITSDLNYHNGDYLAHDTSPE